MLPQKSPEQGARLSQKSRSILFYFKSILQQQKLLLATHISNIFKIRKDKFNRKQFLKLILKYDKKLILSDIDQVFEELDYSGQNYITYQYLVDVLNSINSQDDPSTLLNRNSVQLASSQQISQALALIQFKDALIVKQDYIDVIGTYMTQKDGFLTKQNIKELLQFLQFKNQNKNIVIIKCIFEQNDKIQLKDFLKKLDLDTNGTRIRLSDYSVEQSIILDVRKSQYIKDLQNVRMSHQFNIQYSKILDTLNDCQNTLNSGVYSITKIPKQLQKYFNYGSELQQVFASLATNFLQNNLIYIDEEGPTYGKAKKWVHIAQINPNYFIFQAAQSIIYRAKQRKGLGMLLQPKDITQGKYGNCYFLSALAAIVECYPQLIYRLFVLQKNPSHIYGVRIFVDGIWKTIAVDGCFPLNEQGKFCGAQPHHSQIWVMLLQKAWAKIFKTYQNIHSGFNQQGLIALTGAPIQILLIKQQNFLQRIQQEFKKGSIITCTTAKHIAQMSDQMQQKLGVFSGHAYTILRVYCDVQIKNQNKKIILIKMKNPWGSKAWKGDWSFGSKKWTQQLRTKLNYHIDSKDGTFFICLQDFLKYFDHINISKVNLGYRNSYVTNNANRYDFYCNPVIVQQQGHYYFTIYQQNGRKYKNMAGVYRKSPSWIFLAKIDSINEQGLANLAPVAYSASGYQHTTIQADLMPGHYVLLSKVSWNYWQQHPYVIATYGPGKVILQPCQVAQLAVLNQFIRLRSLQVIQNNPKAKSYYKDTKIWKYFHFDHSQGLGFVVVCNSNQNNENKIIQTTLTLNPCKGIEAIHPFTNPVVIKVKPNEICTACFVVDPMGYSYKLLESYKLFVIK